MTDVIRLKTRAELAAGEQQAYEDRAQATASHIPIDADNYGSLIAAVDDCHYRLMRHTNGG